MADEKSTEPVSIAYYCTGHGYGHATRSIEVIIQIPPPLNILHALSGRSQGLCIMQPVHY